MAAEILASAVALHLLQVDLPGFEQPLRPVGILYFSTTKDSFGAQRSFEVLFQHRTIEEQAYAPVVVGVLGPHSISRVATKRDGIGRRNRLLSCSLGSRHVT